VDQLSRNIDKLLPSDILLVDLDPNNNMNHGSMKSILSSYPNSWYYAYRT
jgi:hypothetical protein